MADLDSAAGPTWDYIAKLVCIGDSGCGKSSLTVRLCEGRFVMHHDVTIGVEFGSRVVPVGPPYSRRLAAASASSQSPPATADAEATEPSPSAAAASPAGLPAPPRPPAPDPPQKHMKLSLWDTAGQETYKSVTRSYFRGASGALLVFDLSRRQTFQHVTDWLNDLRQIAEEDIVVVLVGNKADLTRTSSSGGDGDLAADDEVPNKREVTREEAEAWAKRNNVLEYVETSAKSGENVEMAFMRVAERIFQNIEAGKYDLNDRRSGVKGPAATVPGARTLQLQPDPRRGSSFGCC